MKIGACTQIVSCSVAAAMVWSVHLIFALFALAQLPGDVDRSFDPGSGVDGTVYALAGQPDGKVLIGGFFRTVKDTARVGIARLNQDGSADPSFDPGQGVNFPGVKVVLLEPGGKVLIAGGFTSVDTAKRSGIARLNTDGSLDLTFDPGDGPNAELAAAVLQPDGKVIIGGSFSQVNGATRSVVARLRSNGSVDPEFDGGGIEGIPGRSDPEVLAVAVQPDGKILIAGRFYMVQGQTRYSIARLSPDGRLDDSFHPRITEDGWPALSGPRIDSIQLQPDGKLLIAGEFESVDAYPRTGLARLNLDGSVDAGFAAPGLSKITALALKPDGRILVGASVATNHTSAARVALLQEDGSIDPLFPPVMVEVMCLVAQSDGCVLVGGGFTRINETTAFKVARLSASGVPDPTFAPGLGITGSLSWEVHCVAAQPDGKVLIAGGFDLVGNVSRPGLARLNGEGRLDLAFDVGTIENRTPSSSPPFIYDVKLQTNGQMLIAGQFTHIKSPGDSSWLGQLRNGVARLNHDGRLDPGFVPELDEMAEPVVFALELQPDGKVLVAQRNRLLRLHPDGMRDTSFAPVQGDASSLLLQADGKVLCTGLINGTNRSRLFRVNTDGSLDPSFHTPSDLVEVVSAALDPAGNILVGGWFGEAGGVESGRLVRLHPNGARDDSFRPDPALSGSVAAIVVQPDERILVYWMATPDGGRFSRLYSDGRLEDVFTAFTDGPVFDMQLQPDGNVLFGGCFVSVNRVACWRVARLIGGPLLGPMRLIESSLLTDGRFRFCLSGTSDQPWTIQGSEDLARWDDLRTAAPSTDRFEFEEDHVGLTPRRFYRAIAK